MEDAREPKSARQKFKCAVEGVQSPMLEHSAQIATMNMINDISRGGTWKTDVARFLDRNSGPFLPTENPHSDGRESNE